MTTNSSSQSIRACPKCTFHNRIDAMRCTICSTPFDDGSDIEFLDKENKENKSQHQELSDHRQLNLIKEESRKLYQEEQQLILKNIKHRLKPDININNKNVHDTTTNALYDPKFNNLFSNYLPSNSRPMIDIDEEIKEDVNSTNNHNINNSNDDIKENNNMNHRKRILLPPIIESSVSSPPRSKRRKLTNKKDDDNLISIEQEEEEEEEEEDIDINIDIDSIPEPQRKLIEKGYIKFLNAFINGEFCLDTVIIEFGPEFKGRRTVFNKLKIPFSDHQDEFKTMDNPDLPPYVARIKHHKLHQPFSKSQIYSNADKSGEIEKLNGLSMKGMAQYFLPRLLSNDKFVSEGYTIIRLDWKTFIQIWNTDALNENYESFDHLIQSVRDIIIDPDGLNEPIGIILVLLEHVQQTVNSMAHSNQCSNKIDEYCPWNDDMMLKAKMAEYALFRDNIHIEFVSKDKSAEYIERAAYSLAMDRFERMRVSALTRRPRKSRSKHDIIENFDEKISNKSVFKDMLLTISGVSAATIRAITDKYPTFASLRREYKKSPNPELLLQGLSRRYENSRKRIGAVLSRKIYQQLTGEYGDD